MGVWKTLKDTATLPFRMAGSLFKPAGEYIKDHKFISALAGLYLVPKAIGAGVTGVAAVVHSAQKGETAAILSPAKKSDFTKGIIDVGSSPPNDSDIEFG